MPQRNMLTIRETVQRSRAEGLNLSEYALRLWVKRGEIPARYAGTKALLYWPTVKAYVTGNGA